MASLPLLRFAPQEPFDQKPQAEPRSESFSGGIFAMAGASQRHNLIVSNTVRELSTQFRGRSCQTYASAMRVKVSATGLYAYPDVVAVCGDIQFEDEDRDTLLNPGVVIEVYSRSTEAYDHGEKFAHYRRLESVQEYLLVSEDKALVGHYTRQADGQWYFAEISSLSGRVCLTSVGCELLLADIYEKVEFPSGETPMSSSGAALR